MSVIHKYFDKYHEWNDNKWVWSPYTYVNNCSLEEQQKWNDLYLRTRARKSDPKNPYEDKDLRMPDFYSIERDADQFHKTECTFTDIFGLKWSGKKGCEELIEAPDYEGHLYYYDKDDDDIYISDYTDSDNPPDPAVYQHFNVGYPRFRQEWVDIANIKNVQYHYYVENHLFKDSRISITYDDSWTEGDNIYDDKLEDFVICLKKFGKDDLYDKLMKQINEHFTALKNSDQKDERAYWPGKSAEDFFADKAKEKE